MSDASHLSPALDEVERAARSEITDFLERSLQFRDRTTDLRNAAHWSLGEGLFLTWEDKVAGPLPDAYVLYLHLLVGGEAALEEVLNHPQFPDRERIHRGNRALLAVLLVGGPVTRKQSSASSDYAKYLQYAASHYVEPERFATEMAKIKLSDAKKAIRLRPRRDRADTQPTDGTPQPASSGQSQGPTSAPTHESSEVKHPPVKPAALQAQAQNRGQKEPSTAAKRSKSSRLLIGGFDESGPLRAAGRRLTPAQAKSIRRAFEDKATRERCLEHVLATLFPAKKSPGMSGSPMLVLRPQAPSGLEPKRMQPLTLKLIR